MAKCNVVYMDEVIRLDPATYKKLEERAEEACELLGLDEVDEDVFRELVDAVAGWRKEDKG